jgi:predicted transcriptional regulator
MIEELIEKEKRLFKHQKSSDFCGLKIRRIFKITKNGNEFLEEFNKIKIFSDSFGL